MKKCFFYFALHYFTIRKIMTFLIIIFLRIIYKILRSIKWIIMNKVYSGNDFLLVIKTCFIHDYLSNAWKKKSLIILYHVPILCFFFPIDKTRSLYMFRQKFSIELFLKIKTHTIVWYSLNNLPMINLLPIVIIAIWPKFHINTAGAHIGIAVRITLYYRHEVFTCAFHYFGDNLRVCSGWWVWFGFDRRYILGTDRPFQPFGVATIIIGKKKMLTE